MFPHKIYTQSFENNISAKHTKSNNIIQSLGKFPSPTFSEKATSLELRTLSFAKQVLGLFIVWNLTSNPETSVPRISPSSACDTVCLFISFWQRSPKCDVPQPTFAASEGRLKSWGDTQSTARHGWMFSYAGILFWAPIFFIYDFIILALTSQNSAFQLISC